MYDSKGKLVLNSLRSISESNSLNVSNLSKGLYFLVAKKSNAIVSENKFIK